VMRAAALGAYGIGDAEENEPASLQREQV
jgi:hypothetical protein